MKKNLLIFSTLSSLFPVFMLISAIFVFPLSALNNGFNYFEYTLFILFVLFWIVFPGFSVLSFFEMRLKFGLKLLSSFYLGFGLVIIEYYLFTFTSSRSLLIITSPVIALLFVIIRVFQKKREGRFLLFNVKSLNQRYLIDTFQSLLPFSILATICIIVSGISTLWQYPSPTVTGNIVLSYPDFLWHIGNVNSLANFSNFSDIRISSVIFKYHYFSDLLLAIEKIISSNLGFNLGNLQSFNLVMHDQFSLIGLLVALSFFELINIIIKNKWVVSAVCLIALFWVFYDHINLFGNLFLFHWTTNVSDVSLALPCFIVLIILFGNWQKNNGNGRSSNFYTPPYFSWGLLFLILTFTLTGLKGPMGLVFVGGGAIWIIFNLFVQLYVFFKDKRTLFIQQIKKYSSFFPSIFGFCVVYFFLLKTAGDSTATFSFSTIQILQRSPLINSLLVTVGNHWYFRILLIFIDFLFFTNGIGFFSLLSMFFVFGKIKSNAKRYEFIEFIGFTAAVGIFLTYTVTHFGYSQLYFYFSSIPLLFAGAIFVIQKVYFYLINQFRLKEYIKRGFIGLIMIGGIVVAGLSTKSNIYAPLGVPKLNEFNTSALQPRSFNEPYVDGVSWYEFQGLKWLNEHTSNNVILATNRHSIFTQGWNRFFYYSAFSERKFYVEGTDYEVNSGLTGSEATDLIAKNDELFSSTKNDKQQLAKKLGIQYLVISVYGKENSLPDDEKITKVFSNRDISIFKIEN